MPNINRNMQIDGFVAVIKRIKLREKYRNYSLSETIQ
jgi:hypothetical protein